MCTQYAEARGWTVVATCTDDGVSATHKKPEQYAGPFGLAVDTRRATGYWLWPTEVQQLREIVSGSRRRRAFTLDRLPYALVNTTPAATFLLAATVSHARAA